MFSPSQLPCTAWVLIGAVNVSPLVVCEKLNNDGVFRADDGGLCYAEAMFSTRAEAVAEARQLLANAEAFLLNLQDTVVLHRLAVARLLDEPVAGSAEGGVA